MARWKNPFSRKKNAKENHANSESKEYVEPMTIVEPKTIIESKTISKDNLDQPPNTRVHRKKTYEEKIGILYGLNGEREKVDDYIENILADIEEYERQMADNYSKVKDIFSEAMKYMDETTTGVSNLNTKIDESKKDTIAKLREILVTMMPLELDDEFKKNITEAVIEEKGSLKELSSVIANFNNVLESLANEIKDANYLEKVINLNKDYVKKIADRYEAKIQLEKGYAAGLAMKLNLERKGGS